MNRFTCTVCGKAHPRENMELTLHRPDAIAALPKEIRSERCKESDDLCTYWGEGSESKRFFVRGVLPIPVDGRDVPYRIGAWAEVDKNVFYRIVDLWQKANQSQEPPFSAVLANEIPPHRDALGLKVQLRLTSPTSRPDLIVLDRSHALYHEQTRGISGHKAYEYTRLVA
jgi:hypothetical protein